jgi:hypothetical protein
MFIFLFLKEIILLSQVLVLYNLIYILFMPRLEVASGEVGYYSISFWPVMEIQTRKVAFAGVWYMFQNGAEGLSSDRDFFSPRWALRLFNFLVVILQDLILQGHMNSSPPDVLLPRMLLVMFTDVLSQSWASLSTTCHLEHLCRYTNSFLSLSFSVTSLWYMLDSVCSAIFISLVCCFAGYRSKLRCENVGIQ